MIILQNQAKQAHSETGDVTGWKMSRARNKYSADKIVVCLTELRWMGACHMLFLQSPT